MRQHSTYAACKWSVADEWCVILKSSLVGERIGRCVGAYDWCLMRESSSDGEGIRRCVDVGAGPVGASVQGDWCVSETGLFAAVWVMPMNASMNLTMFWTFSAGEWLAAKNWILMKRGAIVVQIRLGGNHSCAINMTINNFHFDGVRDQLVKKFEYGWELRASVGCRLRLAGAPGSYSSDELFPVEYGLDIQHIDVRIWLGGWFGPYECWWFGIDFLTRTPGHRLWVQFPIGPQAVEGRTDQSPGVALRDKSIVTQDKV